MRFLALSDYLAKYGLNAPTVGLKDSLEVLESVLTLGFTHNSQLQPTLGVMFTVYSNLLIGYNNEIVSKMYFLKKSSKLRALALRMSPSLELGLIFRSLK
jgi:hypothetical protein